MGIIGSESLRRYKKAIRSRETFNEQYFTMAMEYLRSSIAKLRDYRHILEGEAKKGREVAAFLEDSLRMSHDYFQMYIDNGPWTRNSKKGNLPPKGAFKMPEGKASEILKDYGKMAKKLKEMKMKNSDLRMKTAGNRPLSRVQESLNESQGSVF